MKKTLALVLAFALVFSTITVAFADTTTATISADAKACADLGMLVGEGSGVTVDYTATTPSRLQAATMALRLKGLEAEAKAFTGTDNFADVDKVNYADGKAILAYLKAHKELGWVGDGTNFDPTSKVTAQQYYKTLLESLGYKQTTAEVAGDFTYAETLAFAATKGLSKAATAANFTIADLATATVEGLKATVKGGTKTLATTLVEAKALDQAKVDAALNGTTAPATAAAVLDTVRATANDKVEVGFDVAVDKAFAENVANYKIVVRGSTTALEVKSAALASDATYVVLTTAAQTGGTAYTMTVGEKSVNFAGAAKVAGAPEIDTVTCVDTNTVEVVFKKAVDRATAEDVANYTLDKSATVKSAELWASQDDSRKTVKLTTEGVANSKVYTLKVANVKSADAVAMKAASKSFTGITDTTAVKFNGAITVSNDSRIIVHFDDAHGVDKASAETLANWSIKDASGAELKVNKLTAKDNDGDDYGYYEDVEVDTDLQTSGAKYTVTLSNLVDGSVAKNTLTKEITKAFTGKAADHSAPTVASCQAISDTKIKVVFADQNRLEAETLTNISNYVFAKDISVTKAEILRPTKPDLVLGKTVVLTTTAMDSDISSYALTINGITDEFGNVMKTYNKSVSYHAEDITPPYVTAAQWVDLNKVKLTFNETLDSITAEDAANYTINGSLGTVTKAEISGSDTNLYKVVTLTTPTQSENTKYTVTISGLKDLCGNATSDAKGYFTSERDGMDTTRPEITSVDLMNKDELHVTFDEKVSAGASVLTVQYGATWASTTTFNKVGNVLDDGTTVVYKAVDNTITDDNNETFRISGVTLITDKSQNKFVPDTTDYVTFSGNSSANVSATVDSIEQIDSRTIKAVFDEPIVYVPGDAGNITTVAGTGLTVATFQGTVDYDEDGTNDAYSTLTLKLATPMAYNVTYSFDLSTNVRDYMALAATDTSTNTNLTTTIDDQDGPVIEYVEAVRTNKIQVHYNETILSTVPGSYKLYADGASTPLAGVTTTAAVDGDDDTIVNVTVTAGTLTPGTVYDIKPASAAKDLSNNAATTSGVSFSFVASGVTVQNYIKGVTVVNSQRIKIYATTDLGLSTTPEGTGADATVSVKNAAGSELKLTTLMPGDSANDDNDDLTFVQVDLKTPLVNGATYTVAAVGLTSTFVADVEEGGISIDANDVITFSSVDVDDYVVTIAYTDISGATFTLYVKPIDTDAGAPVVMQFDATNDLFAFANGTADTADATLLQVKNQVKASVTGNIGYYTINVYRTNGVADTTISAAQQTWANYLADITGNMDAAPLYSTKVDVAN